AMAATASAATMTTRFFVRWFLIAFSSCPMTFPPCVWHIRASSAAEAPHLRALVRGTLGRIVSASGLRRPGPTRSLTLGSAHDAQAATSASDRGGGVCALPWHARLGGSHRQARAAPPPLRPRGLGGGPPAVVRAEARRPRARGRGGERDRIGHCEAAGHGRERSGRAPTRACYKAGVSRSFIGFLPAVGVV